MLLKELLSELVPEGLDPSFAELDVQSICSDSRQAKKDSLFVALKGFSCDGFNFSRDAVNRGARVIVTEEPLTSLESGTIYNLTVPDTFVFLRQLAKKFYDDPSRHIGVIGITGTNGKTTITYLIETILQVAEKSCGVIGTVNYRIGAKTKQSLNTTPGFLDNQQYLTEMVHQGLDYCVMEVSSHALDQHRVDLISFKAAVFTNLTSDHLDYHLTRENYFNAKAQLFINLPAESTAIINVDDLYGRKLIAKTPAKVISYGISNNADVTAKEIEIDISGTRFKVCHGSDEVTVRSRLVGMYNVYNILAAVACCLSEGIGLEKIKAGLEKFIAVPGRLEPVDCQQDFSIFIDYAHTQDALENVLRTIRQASDARIILVFGCGGDRDKTKRPLMGRVAGQWADHCIVTSDNPRSEDPEDIISQIVEGFEKDNFEVIVEREEAIKKALSIAQKGDIIILTGKGHETYQVFKDRTIKLDERQVIREFLRC